MLLLLLAVVGEAMTPEKVLLLVAEMVDQVVAPRHGITQQAALVRLVKVITVAPIRVSMHHIMVQVVEVAPAQPVKQELLLKVVQVEWVYKIV
jgi:hypothetical protein